MNREFPSNFPPVNIEKTAPDLQWHDRLAEFGKFQDFKYLEGDANKRKEEFERFVAEENAIPNLDYPKFETLDFQKIESGLLRLKQDILQSEKSDVIKQAYQWRINEKLAEIRMLRAVSESDDKRFSRYSTFIYGKPEQSLHAYTLLQVSKVIREAEDSQETAVLEAVARLKNELDLENVESDIQFTDFNVPSVVSTKNEQELNAQDICSAFEQALQEARAEGWQAVLKRKSGGVDIDHETKTVYIPEQKKLKETKLKGLIAHEIKTHVQRSVNGESSSKLKLLGLGLDRFWKGDEGIATMEQQKIEGANDFAGFDGHFAIALAMGMDGKKRNFREVFNILRDLNFIKSKKTDREEALKKAEQDAWNRCVRTFRGTTCQQKGMCFTKDIIYREGNIGVWRILNNNPDGEIKFQVGLYDPTNKRHLWILEQLGISDEDLENLDSTLEK